MKGQNNINKFNKLNNSNNSQCYKTDNSCPKSGIKIHKSDNDYKTNPFENKSCCLEQPKLNPNKYL